MDEFNDLDGILLKSHLNRDEIQALYTCNLGGAEGTMLDPRAAHIGYRMQECVVHRSIKAVGREPSWRRHNLEYGKALAPSLFPVKEASK